MHAPATTETGSGARAVTRRENKGWVRPLSLAVNVLLVLVLALLFWVIHQEAFSELPRADSVEAVARKGMHGEALTSAALDGADVVLVYDLTGRPYFDRQEQFAGEFETVARTILDEFRRVERVRVTILQEDERYEGLSVTDGFGRLLSWF